MDSFNFSSSSFSYGVKPLEDVLTCDCSFTVKGYVKRITFDFFDIIIKNEKDKTIQKFTEALDKAIEIMYIPGPMNRLKAYDLAKNLVHGMDGGSSDCANEIAKDMVKNPWLIEEEDVLECDCSFTIKRECGNTIYDFSELIYKHQRDKLVHRFTEVLDKVLDLYVLED